MNKRFSNSSLYFFVSIAQKLISCALLPIYTYYLDQYNLGIVSVCASVSTLAPLLVFLGISDAVYFLSLRSESPPGSILRVALHFQSRVFLLAASGVVLLTIWLKNKLIFNIPVYPYLFFSLMAGLLGGFFVTSQEQLRASERMKEYSLFGGIQFTLTTTLAVLFLIYFQRNALSIILAAVFSNSITALLTLWWGRVDTREKLPKIRELLSFSTPLVPHNFAHWIKGFGDRIALSYFTTTQAAGIYFVAVNIVQPFYLGVNSFAASNNPRFFQLSQTKHWRQVTDMLLLSTAGFSAAAIAFGLFAPNLVSLLTSPTFHSTSQFIPVLLSAMLFWVIYSNLVLVIYQQKKSRLLAVITLVALSSSFLTTLVLIVTLSVLGAAIGAVFANMLLVAAVYLFCQKLIKLPWPIFEASFIALLPCLLPLIEPFFSQVEAGLQVVIKIGIACTYLLIMVIFLRARGIMGETMPFTLRQS